MVHTTCSSKGNEQQVWAKIESDLTVVDRSFQDPKRGKLPYTCFMGPQFGHSKYTSSVGLLFIIIPRKQWTFLLFQQWHAFDPELSLYLITALKFGALKIIYYYTWPGNSSTTNGNIKQTLVSLNTARTFSVCHINHSTHYMFLQQ